MSADGSKCDVLRRLMEDALQSCMALQKYSDEHFEVFLGDDDDKIIEVVTNREEFIETLAGLENRIDVLLDEVVDDSGDALPPDVDELRHRIRAVLTDVSAKDMEIMKIISGRMQTYKNETLKARNKKNLSAYLRSAIVSEPGDSVDFTK